jgi:hypothetical protein
MAGRNLASSTDIPEGVIFLDASTSAYLQTSPLPGRNPQWETLTTTLQGSLLSSCACRSLKIIETPKSVGEKAAKAYLVSP